MDVNEPFWVFSVEFEDARDNEENNECIKDWFNFFGINYVQGIGYYKGQEEVCFIVRRKDLPKKNIYRILESYNQECALLVDANHNAWFYYPFKGGFVEEHAGRFVRNDNATGDRTEINNQKWEIV